MITFRHRGPTATAILVYVPDTKTFIDQFWGLYHSTLISKNKGAFDFVVVAPQTAVEKLPQENCHIFPRDELSLDEKYRTKYNNEPYRYVNSFHHFVDAEVIQFLKDNYQYCFRLDVDTFVTPQAYLLGTHPGEIKVGHGGYYGEIPKQHLKDHCESLGFSFCHNYPIGSTWFGHTKDILEAGKTALEFCEYLISQDPTFSEKEGSWPEWYAGVITMYAGHLAFCKLSHLKVNIFKFDVGVTDKQCIDEAYSLHCWHTPDFFSKFAFAAGDYKETEVEDWARSRRASDYAYFCASKGQSSRQKRYMYDDEIDAVEEIRGDIIARVCLDKHGIVINVSDGGEVEIRKT